MKKLLILLFLLFSVNSYAKDVKNLEDKCNKGDFASCNNLGGRYYDGEGVKQDYNKAVDLFSKACELKYNKGCYNYSKLKEELGGYKYLYLLPCQCYYEE